MPLQIESLPYPFATENVFSQLLSLPWPVFLDSSSNTYKDTRYDIMAADPWLKLQSCQGKLVAYDRDNQLIQHQQCDPLEFIRHFLPQLPPNDLLDLPFTGGAIGYLGYDLNHQFNHDKVDLQIPLLSMGIYDWAIIVDHQQQASYFVSQGLDPNPRIDLAYIKKLLTQDAINYPFALHENWQQNYTKQQYQDKFKQIKQHIYDGNCYQINLSLLFSNRFSGNPWQHYRKLRQNNPSPYGGYFQFDDVCILSCSPERFLYVRDNMVETKPMKGTRPRSENPSIDEALKIELQRSEKDRAENLMIIDLLRNDLGKCCEPGSIKVTDFFSIESFTNVHQMISRICGKLQKGKTAIDLLNATFPGGSITGTPKIRAMEIIDQLEPHQRWIYCGTLGYISYTGEMDSNIAIRSMFTKNNRIFTAAGSAIVADSDVDQEYEECLLKVSKLL